MSIKDNGGPAFPETCGDQIVPGMTLRDYFAAKALQGLLANAGGPIQANGMSGWGFCNSTVQHAAKFAYEWADAMLAERAK